MELSDGRMGIVAGVRHKDLLRPQVIISADRQGRRPESLSIVDLALGEDLYIARPLDDMGKGVNYDLASPRSL